MKEKQLTIYDIIDIEEVNIRYNNYLVNII